MEFASSQSARVSLAGLDAIVALEYARQSVPATASSLVSWILVSVIQVLLAAIVNSNPPRKSPATEHAKTECVTTTRIAFANQDSPEKIVIQKHALTIVAGTAFVFQMASVAATMATQALTVVFTRRRMRAQKHALAMAC